MRASIIRFLFVALLPCAASPALLAGPKIGVLLKSRNAYWSAMEKGAVSAGEKLGVEIAVKSPLSESDVSVQIQMLNALAGQGIAALVIAPCNKDALAAPVAAVAAKGVKIVVVDSPIGGDAPPVYIATDNKAAGAEAGRLLASLLGASDEMAMLKHLQNSGATGQREAGAFAALRAAHPKATIHSEIYASAEKDSENEKANFLLSTYPNVKGVLATGTLGTMAMLRVLQEKRPPGAVKFIGFGFNLNPEVAAAIDSGMMQGWIAQLPQDMGAKGVAAALALLKGETVTPVVHTEFIVITKANLHQPDIQALLTL